MEIGRSVYDEIHIPSPCSKSFEVPNDGMSIWSRVSRVVRGINRIVKIYEFRELSKRGN